MCRTDLERSDRACLLVGQNELRSPLLSQSSASNSQERWTESDWQVFLVSTRWGVTAYLPSHARCDRKTLNPNPQYRLNDVFNCSDYWVDFRIDGSDYCLGDLEKSSVNFYYNVFHVGDFVDTHCMPLCPLECSLYRYDLHKSLDRYPSDSYVEHTLRTNPILRTHFANHTDFKLNLAQNVVKFTVKFDSLAYLEARESKQTSWFGLLAELGGHFHLFVGMSLLSVIELFELLF